MTTVLRGDDNFDTEGIIEGTAKAWVNYRGKGVVGIQASLNISSVVETANGAYTLNFETSMPDVNYVTVCGQQTAVDGSTIGNHFGVSFGGTASSQDEPTLYTVDAVAVVSITQSGSNNDLGYFYVSVFGN